MTEEERQKHRDIASRGVRAQRFMDSDFYKHDLEPFLKEKMNAANTLNSSCIFPILSSGKANPSECIALTMALNSGQLAFIKSFLEEIRLWISEGEKKNVKLEEEDAKKN